MNSTLSFFVLCALPICAFAAQPQPAAVPQPAPQPAKAPAPDLAAATTRGIEILLSLQEGENKAEWPYEGVYRVGGKIPVGYRIGSTAIVVEALVRAPGYATDKARVEAVGRAVKFICEARNEPTMSEVDYDGGYDVRGWGYIYGLKTLSILKQMKLIPEGQEEAVKGATAFYLDALQKIEIPEAGGWNYARPPGRKTVAPTSPFMTPSGLEALYEAKAAGEPVDAGVVQRALDGLEKCRGPAGAMQYSGPVKRGDGEPVPGAVGRMCASESALLLAGRSSPERVRGAVDAFIVHWKFLNERRAKTGTHLPPYQIAPYYFMYAHHFVAQAIELLPRAERAEYRRRVNELLFSVREEDGSWNDRVFKRSSAYGTAMAMLAVGMPEATPPARWEGEKK
ncbi:MAG: prenyltransferase/squalene oxidase repeat-containing protein [Planctomycetota bacterium]